MGPAAALPLGHLLRGLSCHCPIKGFGGQGEALPGGHVFLRPALSILVPTVNTFWVTVQRTEAAERCELRGSYVLKAERDSLVLKDPRTNEILYVWPYRLLRRYGRDKVGLPCVPRAEACFPAGFPLPKVRELMYSTSL